MYLFAHVFSGILLGLVFWHLTADRRAVPVCIAGAVLPDLIDKPLALFIPGIFGSSRTIGHTLLISATLLIAGLLLWRYRHTLLGVAFAGAVFSHQVFDSIWNLPGTWYFPLLGPFPVILVQDYVRHSLWLELASPSELVFACASAVFIMGWYLTGDTAFSPGNSATLRWLAASIACILGVMGVCLVIAGLNGVPGTFFAPAYTPLTSLMAGLLASCGAAVLVLSIVRAPGIPCRV